MSCAPIYQIKATGLLPKQGGRMATACLSLLPAFAQQAQPASSAVVFSYILLGKDHRGRGARQLRVSSIFWILSKPTSVCSPRLWFARGVSWATHCKTTTGKVRVYGDLSTYPQMTHPSLHLIMQLMTRVNKFTPWHTQLLIKNIPQNRRRGRHYTQTQKGIPSWYSSYMVIWSQFPIRHYLLLTSQKIFWVKLRGNVYIQACYYKCQYD